MMKNSLLRRRFLSTLPALGSVWMHGCSRTSKKYFVAFSQCNNSEPYRAAQNTLLQKLASQNSEIRLVVSDAQQDNSVQIAQVEAFIRQRPDLLIVAPNEQAPLTAVMGDAVKAGIRVICLERDILLPNYTSYIRCDNRAIGRMAGEAIVEHLKKKYGSPKGNIVQLHGLLGVEGEANRNAGALEVFAQYPGIKIVHEAVADWVQAKAKDRMTEILRAEAQIDVVYGHNDPMAIGAYLAAKELDREKNIFFVGVDGLGGPAGGIKKVMDGILGVTFVYPLCVDKALEVGMKSLTDPNFKIEKTYTIPSAVVTPQNAAQLYQKLTF